MLTLSPLKEKLSLFRRRKLSLFLLLFLLLVLPLSVFLVQKRQEYRGKATTPEIPGLNIKLEWGGGVSEIIFDGKNIVNDADTGRLIQLSIYDFSETINNWPWNPVQGGDYRGNGSPVLNSQGKSYVKTRPLQWQGDNQGNRVETDVYFEQWIEQPKQNVYKVKYRVTSFEERSRSGHHEVPAVYINWPYTDLIYYDGSEPWTSKPITRKTQGDLEREGVTSQFVFSPSEKWAGLVTGGNRGIFIYQPNALSSFWWPTVHGVQNLYYLAPLEEATYTPQLPKEHEFYILLGNVEDVRREVYALHEVTPVSTPTPAPPPTPTPTPTPTPSPAPTPTTTPTPKPTPTMTPTPTLSPTPTPTLCSYKACEGDACVTKTKVLPCPPDDCTNCAAYSATLNFKIKFQGISQEGADRQVEIILKKDENIIETRKRVSVFSNENGVYTGNIFNIDPGTYDIFIKGWAHLEKKFPKITLKAGENRQDFSQKELLAGDATGDNKINAQDVVILVEHYRPNTPLDSPADFNLDGVVNAQDVRFLVENYRQEGEK